jgi:hypothetical protein
VVRDLAATLDEDYGIRIRASWGVFEICKNFYVIEIPRYKYDALIEQVPASRGRGRGMVIIYVRKGMSNKQKALAVEHEKAHLVQFCKENAIEQKLSRHAEKERDERVAEEAEVILASLLKHYPPYSKGLLTLSRELKRGSICRVCGST